MRAAIVLGASLLFVRTAGADVLREQLARLETVQGERVPAPLREARASDDERRSVRRQGKRRHAHAKRERGELEALLAEAARDDREQITALLGMLDDGERAPVDRSRSRGSAHAGSLDGAVQVPDHAGYVVRDRSRAWGTPNTVDLLVHAFDEVLARDPRAPRVRVHDLSLRYGGPMDGHKSHQSGRDVDMTYYQHGCLKECLGRRVAPDALDAERQWQLLRRWLERDLVEFVFVDYSLQRPLYEAALASGTSAQELGRWFQYPRGSAFPSGIIRHVPNHANHVHVRFRCPPAERTCRSTATRRVSNGGDSASPLFELVEDESESELLELLAD